MVSNQNYLFLDSYNFFLENTTEVRNMSNLTPRVSAIYLKPTMQEVEKDTLSFSLDINLLKITSLNPDICTQIVLLPMSWFWSL